MSGIGRFIEELLITVPEVQSIYKAHLAENNGVLLPHVFMGDVTRFALGTAWSAAGQDALRKLLVVIEEGLQSNESEVPNFVAVSFVENLCGEDDAVGSLIPLMGDTTRKELRSLCGY